MDVHEGWQVLLRRIWVVDAQGDAAVGSLDCDVADLGNLLSDRPAHGAGLSQC